MIWLTWRQLRAQAVTGLALLAAATAYFVSTGLSIRHAYSADLSRCAGHVTCDLLSGFRGGYAPMFDLTQTLMIVVLGLIGAFWGAPLIGRELESGTHQLAWNQSVTRTRWLAVKLAVVAAATAVTAGVLSFLLTWWAGPLDPIGGSRFSGNKFATHDIAPVGYAVLAFAVAATAGLLIRRTLPAMAVTFAVFVGMQVLMPTLVRPHLITPTTVTYTVDQSTEQLAQGMYTTDEGGQIYLADLPVPRGAWIESAPPIEDAAGLVVSTAAHPDCFAGQGTIADSGQSASCLAGYDLHESISYLPADDYWPLQWYETGILTALAAALSGFCFWWIRRRRS